LSNPVDMTAPATPEQYLRAIEEVGQDDQVDSVIVVYIPPFATDTDAVARAIAQGAGALPVDKPILSVFISSRGAPPALGGGPRGSLPSYTFPENAADALAAAHRYGRWRARPRGEFAAFDEFAQSTVRAVIDRVVAADDEPIWLSDADVATLLLAAGIPQAAAETCSPADAVTTAEQLGYPLVAKAVAPGIVHKSDVGGVIMGLESADAVAAAVESLKGNIRDAGAELQGVLLQREVRGGIEALVGVTSDPTFGPLVVCGLGGTLVEVLRDVSFRLTPVSDVDAREMIAGLRSAPLLDGYRGAPAGDREALVAIIQRISVLVDLIPELRELDLNPVKVLAPGKGAVVVDARIRVGAIEGAVATQKNRGCSGTG
jgi:acyl-CoA synthetase (NDP forming)